MDSNPDQPDLEYLLGVGAGVGAGPSGTTTAAAGNTTTADGSTVAAVAAGTPFGLDATLEPATGAASTASAEADGGDGPGDEDEEPGSRKRKADDKAARQTKRKMRNRELARASNQKRRLRIQTMENELTETRKTVETLEESIKCLEAENKELINLLQSKPDQSGNPAPVQTAPSGASPAGPAPTATPAVVQQPSTATQ